MPDARARFIWLLDILLGFASNSRLNFVVGFFPQPEVCYPFVFQCMKWASYSVERLPLLGMFGTAPCLVAVVGFQGEQPGSRLNLAEALCVDSRLGPCLGELLNPKLPI